MNCIKSNLETNQNNANTTEQYTGIYQKSINSAIDCFTWISSFFGKSSTMDREVEIGLHNNQANETALKTQKVAQSSPDGKEIELVGGSAKTLESTQQTNIQPEEVINTVKEPRLMILAEIYRGQLSRAIQSIKETLTPKEFKSLERILQEHVALLKKYPDLRDTQNGSKSLTYRELLELLDDKLEDFRGAKEKATISCETIETLLDYLNGMPSLTEIKDFERSQGELENFLKNNPHVADVTSEDSPNFEQLLGQLKEELIDRRKNHTTIS